MTIEQFATAVHIYCGRMKASETSGQRTHAHNLKVGGVLGSPHRFGLAKDVVYDEKPPLEHAQAAARLLGLMIVREGDHDHIQPADWKNRPELDVA